MAADLAAALERSGNVHNIVLSPANELISKIIRAKAEHRLCRTPRLFNLSQEISRLSALIFKLKPDIIQVYEPMAAYMAKRACKSLKKQQQPPCIGVISSYPDRYLFLRAYKFCTALCCVSWEQRKLLVNKGLQARRLDLLHIPYGVNEQQCNPHFQPSADKLAQWRTQHPEANGKLTLCIPGAISPLHGLEDLADIMKRLLQQGIPTHAYIAGDTKVADSAYLKKLNDTFAAESLSNHISWIGARPDLREVLCCCDVTLSLAHGSATCDRPVLEALALGRPVIGYDHGIVGELLEAFLPEGRVTPHDTAAVADILSQWHMYAPSTITEVPQPYRLSDTVNSFLKLYQSHIKSGDSGTK